MEPVIVRKSLLRQLLLILAGALLILAAVDIMVLHRVSTPPEVDSATGEINPTGLSQQRSDRLWGTILIVAGGVLVSIGGAGAAGRVPAVVIGEDGLRLRVAGFRRSIVIPWDEVRWVHSGSDGDDEQVPTGVLLVHVTDPSRYPRQPWGADWDGATLMVDAGSWDMMPSDVVIHANVVLANWRRRHEGAAADIASGASEHDDPGRITGTGDGAG